MVAYFVPEITRVVKSSRTNYGCHLSTAVLPSESKPKGIDVTINHGDDSDLKCGNSSRGPCAVAMRLTFRSADGSAPSMRTVAYL